MFISCLIENIFSSQSPYKNDLEAEVFRAAGAPELLVTFQRTSANTSEFDFPPQSLAFTVQAISLTLYLSSSLYLAGI